MAGSAATRLLRGWAAAQRGEVMSKATNGLTRRSVLAGAAALGLPAVLRPAAAADGVDLDAAKREGKVSLYTSAPIAAAQKVATAFEQKFGIKVELFRSGGTEVLRRFMMERDAGRIAADVLVTSDPAAAIDFSAKGLFVPFRPAGFERVPAALNDPAGSYVAQRVSLIAIYARTDLIAAADMPKTWDDLILPKYKGKLVMTDPSFTSLQVGVVAMMSKLRGWDYYEQLNKNDVLIVPGNEQAVNLVKTGERPIAAGADAQYANEARLASHPIQNIFPADGTFAIPAVTGVVKGAAHPNAAKLLAEYHLSLEAQRLWPAQGVYAARSDVEPPAGSPAIATIKVLPMDFPYIQRVTPAVKKKFHEIFS
jgi:iron(III) transport system substrate-binding protein